MFYGRRHCECWMPLNPKALAIPPAPGELKSLTLLTKHAPNHSINVFIVLILLEHQDYITTEDYVKGNVRIPQKKYIVSNLAEQPDDLRHWQ